VGAKSVTLGTLALTGGVTRTTTDATNYKLTTPVSNTATITPAPVTISATKTYDGTTDLISSQLTITGISGANLGYSIGDAAFSDANVVGAKSVTLGTLALTGGVTRTTTDATNYKLTTPVSNTATISPLALIVSGITSSSSEYGSDLKLGVISFINVVSGDQVSTLVTVDVSSERSSSGKYIAGSYTQSAGTSLTGTSANNYTFAGYRTDSKNYTVDKLALTGSIADGSSVYGSDLTPGAVTFDNKVGSDVLIPATVSVATAGNTSTSGKLKYGSYTGAQSISDLRGVDAGNYTYAAITGNYSVSKLALTGSIADATSVYGSVLTPGSVTFGNKVGSDVLIPATVSVATAGNTSTSGNLKYGSYTGAQSISALEGVDAGNYTYAAITGNYSVSKKTVTLSATKNYDGTTDLTGYVTITTGVGTETLSYTGATANDPNVVTANKYIKTITLENGSNGGLTSNYQLPILNYTNAPVTINTLSVIATSFTTLGVTKTYGDLVTLSDYYSLSSSGVPLSIGTVFISNPTISFSGNTVTEGSLITVNVGTHPITASGGSVNSNYTVTFVNAGNLIVNRKPITVTADNKDKIYGAANPAFTYAVAEDLTGLSAVTGSLATTAGTTSAVGAFDITQGTVTNTTNGNYDITFNKGTLTINRKPITISGITAANKDYDGNDTAQVNTASAAGWIVGDNILVYSSGKFSDENAGNGKTVTLTSSYGGTSVGNYTIADQTTTTANISRKAITISGITAADKPYDGNDVAQISTASATGWIVGDNVIVSASGKFSDKNAGDGKIVTLTSSYSGLKVGNYIITDQPTTTASISKKAVTASVSAANKEYNGNDTASITLIYSNLVGSETLTTASSSATFSDKNVGTGKTVTVNSITLGNAIDGSGGLAANYSITKGQTTTASITAKSITVQGLTISNKDYDGNTDAVVAGSTGATFTGKITDDKLEVVNTGITGKFNNENVGDGKSVALSGITLSGDDARNYVVSAGTATANITPKKVTLSANKVYDGALSLAGDVTIGTGVGLETLTYTGATSNDAHVATTGKYINAITLADGSNGGVASNYKLPDLNNENAPVIITAKTLTPTISNTGVTKVYDGSKDTSITPTYSFAGLVDGDSSATLNNTGKAYNDEHVVGANIITVSGLDIAGITGTKGSQNTDYVLDTSSKTVAATITARTLTPTITNTEVTKVYDSTKDTSITPTYSFSGLVDGDGATLTNTSKVYNSADVLSATRVTVSGLSIAGITGTNTSAITDYVLDSTSKTVSATITAKALTIGSATGVNKVYDSTREATISAIGNLDGFVGSEIVIPSVNTATFSDKNVGDGKTVTVNYTLANGTGGGIGSNYSLADNTTTANITPKPITVIGLTAENKVYDGNPSATLIGTTGLTNGAASSTDKKYYTGDDVKVTGTGVGTFSDKDAANSKTVTITGFTFSGTDGDNYSFSAPTTTADITPRSWTISGITGVEKQYDGTTFATLNTDNINRALDTVNKTGLIPSDEVIVTATGLFDSKNVGNINIKLATTISGKDVGNYSITTQTTATGKITRAPLTIKPSDSAKFVTEDDPVDTNYNGATYTGLKGADISDVITGTITRSDYPKVNSAGKYDLTARDYSTRYNNYDITYQPGKFTIVGANTLLVSVTVKDKDITDGSSKDNNIIYADSSTYTLRARYLKSDGSTITTLSDVTVTNNSVVANDGVGEKVSFDILPSTATYSGSGNINVGSYELIATNTEITGINFNNPMVLTGSLTVNSKTIAADVAITGVSKIYDGNNNITKSNSSVTVSNSVIAADPKNPDKKDDVSAYAIGSYTDANVGEGKTITLDSFLSGTDAKNYVIGNARITQNIGQITQLDSVTYTGATGGSWSTPSNWYNGAIPIANNVKQVNIPTGIKVIYDYANLNGDILNNQYGVNVTASKVPTSTIANNGGTLDILTGTSITFSNLVSGTGGLSISGSGSVTLNTATNTYTGGTTINNGATLIIGDPKAIPLNTLSSNSGILKVSEEVVLSSLTVNGAVTLASDINTTGDQTYNGAVTLGAGYGRIVSGIAETPMVLSTVNSNITFAETLAAKNLVYIDNPVVEKAYINQQSLEINVGTGTVTFGGIVGLDYKLDKDYKTTYTYSDYSNDLKANLVPNIYQLTVNAPNGKIVIQNNITTFDKQTYNGPVIIGSSTDKTKPTTIILLSEDPTIIFKNTVDDSVDNGHDLYVRAISINGAASPAITFEGAVGSKKIGENWVGRLKSLTVETGAQDTFASALYSAIAAEKYDGTITTNSIATYGDQIYSSYGDDTLTGYVKNSKNISTYAGEVTWRRKTRGGTAPDDTYCKGKSCFGESAPAEPTTTFANTDLESILREQNERTDFGGQENTPYSGSGTLSVTFCGAKDDFMDKVREQCD
jgi:autotransporter-associated beta strand protein